MIVLINRYSLFFLLFVFEFCLGQAAIDEVLKKELDGIFKSDQILREYIDSETTENRKNEILVETGYSANDLSNGKVFMIMNDRDSINLVRIEGIIAKYGYPGKTLVGEPTNEAAWHVIQHSKKIADYYPMIEEAGSTNELSYTKVAMMHDRLLTQQGKEQLYGTQGAGMYILEPTSGKKEFWRYIWPIQNAAFVNELRKEAGFRSTVEENAKRMGIVYKTYTMEEIKQLTIKE